MIIKNPKKGGNENKRKTKKNIIPNMHREESLDDKTFSFNLPHEGKREESKHTECFKDT